MVPESYLLSISGGWNNNPTSLQFEATFRHLMVRCGVKPSSNGNVAALDETVSLSLLGSESTVALVDDQHEVGPSPFEDVCNVVLDHDYLPTSSGALIDNALVYIAGWVVKKVLKKLDCNICRNKLVSDSLPTSLGDSYHLLRLRNQGGLVIPSPGTVKVITTAERYMRRLTNIKSATNQLKVAQIDHLVRAEVGNEDIFNLGEHVIETQHGIDNHHFQLLSVIVHAFHLLRQYHIARLNTSVLQRGNLRKVYGKNLHFKGH